MKHILPVLLILFVSNNGFCQLQYADSINISREQWRDSLFRIDKNQVPTGILTEYSLFPFESGKYDGLNNDDDTVKTDGQIFMLQNTLYDGIVNVNASLIMTDSLYTHAFNHYNTSQSNPFILIYKSYNRIRQTALNEGLLSITPDGVGMVDVAGRTVSPYDTYTIFAFSPFKTFITQFNAVKFSFPAELWETGSVTNINIDFGDGTGYKSIHPNDSLSIYYDSEGFKTLTAQVTINGITRTAHSTINYTRPDAFIQPSYQWNIDTVARVYINDNDYLGINQLHTFGSDPVYMPNGTVTGANVLVENGCDGVFDKPVIIVEGFDPGDKIDAMKLRDNFRNDALISTLKAYGYDLVYVDFKNNRDYIENNAKVLEAVINKVNQVKSGSNKISIIGYSMGGLVVRWCLKDMEDRGLNHNVDKYFSYDAPHQGANIPLGCQYLFKEIIRDLPYLKWFNAGSTSKVAGMKDLNDAFDSPAGRQMLITKASYNNSAFNWNPNLNTLDPLRSAFAQRLQNKGYPQQTTNYGIAFGEGNNIAGTKNAGNGYQWGNFQPGSVILNGGLNWFLVLFHTTVRAVPENNNQAAICNYRFSGLTVRHIFGIPYLTYVLRVRNFNYMGQYPYDDAPGGYENTQFQFANSLSKVTNGIAPDAVTDGHNGHCFVPVSSSLDLQNQNYSAANNWQSNNMFFNIDSYIQNPYTPSGGTLSNISLSPFSQIVTGSSTYGYTSGYNQDHNGIIQSNFAEFILNKILGFDRSLNCANEDFCSANPTISGPSTICTTATYTANGLPSGLTIVWSSMYGSFKITSGQGTNQIQVSKSFNYQDSIILSLTNSCGTTRQIKYGVVLGAAPAIGISSYSNLSYCGDYSFIILPSTGYYIYQGTLNASASSTLPTTYSWSAAFNDPESNVTWWNNGNGSVTVATKKSPSGITLRCTARNACGSAANLYSFSTGALCPDVVPVSPLKFSIVPNPASNSVTVSVASETAETYLSKQNAQSKNLNINSNGQLKNLNVSNAKIYAIKITDVLGRERRLTNIKEGISTIKVPLTGITSGVYFLSVFDGANWSTQKIVVQ